MGHLECLFCNKTRASKFGFKSGFSDGFVNPNPDIGVLKSGFESINYIIVFSLQENPNLTKKNYRISRKASSELVTSKLAT